MTRGNPKPKDKKKKSRTLRRRRGGRGGGGGPNRKACLPPPRSARAPNRQRFAVVYSSPRAAARETVGFIFEVWFRGRRETEERRGEERAPCCGGLVVSGDEETFLVDVVRGSSGA